ncbi:alpha/beta fold hydrolase [Phytohabitans sp. LJ34]|uniref:alpha/beta fold hydrolase n=1 Tax=Phytohabitans sp. LJ34 TaxID=3452217 RepID=UPI003F8CE56C
MTLAFHTAGVDSGRPVLLIHGGAEDAGMLAPQAEAIAARGRRVIWYDRRGTGGSTRQDWPGSGADQHADDAAELLTELAAGPATVLGFSSGGLVALALAARHPHLVGEAIAWEPPAVAVLPDGLATHAAIMAPVDAHLAAHPGDWTGAYLVMLAIISNGAADPDSPQVRRSIVNAEAIVRDDGPLITRRTFAVGELPAGKVTVAVGERADPMHLEIAKMLAEITGTPYVAVPGADDHEVYLNEPEVLAAWVDAR